MYDLELFVIEIYCLIDDELYPHFCQVYGKPRRAGFEPDLTDSECLHRSGRSISGLFHPKATL